MKATIDLDEALYRRLKVEAARRGRTVRELVADGIRAVIDAPPAPDAAIDGAKAPDWYGSLSSYARRAEQHDLDAMRASIARGRKQKKAR
jgi:plasmid stability protein